MEKSKDFASQTDIKFADNSDLREARNYDPFYGIPSKQTHYLHLSLSSAKSQGNETISKFLSTLNDDDDKSFDLLFPELS